MSVSDAPVMFPYFGCTFVFFHAPVEIPYFRCVVHTAGGQEVSGAVPADAPHSEGVVGEGVHALSQREVPHLHCGVATACRQLPTPIKKDHKSQ